MENNNCNIQINEKYEIHFESGFAVVKRIFPLQYIRIRGNSYQRLLALVNTLDCQSQCETYLALLFSSLKVQKKEEMRLGIRINSTTSCILKAALSHIPGFLLSNQSAAITILAASVLYLLLFPFFLIPSTQSSDCPLYLFSLIINVVLHEIGHIIGCLAAGRDVHKFGFKLNFGFPMLFVDTIDICMSSKKDRVFTSLGGVYVNSLLCIFFTLFFVIFNSQAFALCATISFCFIISNLIPFFRFDGYFVLAELFSEPMLKEKSKKYFVDIVAKRQDLNTHSLFIALYFLMDSLFIAIVIICAVIQLLEIFI